MSLNVLLVGSGGREHALAWALERSSLVESIICVPGNGGTSSLSKVTNIDTISPESFPDLLQISIKYNCTCVSILHLHLSRTRAEDM